MISLAFYKGLATDPWHRVQDAGIRFATRGKYSHVEFIAGSSDFGQPLECLSSSGRDGGVRSKVMVLKPAHWDLVHLAIDADGLANFIRSRIGARYDSIPACCCRMFWRSVAMMKTGGSVRKSSLPHLAFRTRSACCRSCCSMWSHGATAKP